MTVTITISGPQGAGKSTLANALNDILNHHGVPSSIISDDEDNSERSLEEALTKLGWLSLQPVEVEITTTNEAP